MKKLLAVLILVSLLIVACVSDQALKDAEAKQVATEVEVVAATKKQTDDIAAGASDAVIAANDARLVEAQRKRDLAEARVAAERAKFNAAVDARVAQIDAGGTVVTTVTPLLGPYGAIFGAIAGIALGLWRSFVVKQRGLDTIAALSANHPGPMGAGMPGVVVSNSVAFTRGQRALINQAHGMGGGLPF